MQVYLSRKEQYVVALLLLAILAALLVSSYSYGRRMQDAGPAQPFFTAGTAGAAPAAAIIVHVAGAVRNPGVYSFTSGARVNDAILQAGGALPAAYPDALNLAARLTDEEKIYLPTREEWEQSRQSPNPPQMSQPDDRVARTAAKASKSEGDNAGAGAKKVAPTGEISINTATKEQLMSVPGIGAVTAQNIIDYRHAKGAFTDLSQLLNISRIGPKKLDKLAPHLKL